MIFTYLTRADMYMQCVHRSVAPGERFIVPWLEVRENRAVRMAMNNGALAWESQDGEPHIPGSAVLPTAGERAESERRTQEARKAAAEKAERKLEERRRADDEAVKANMARMGHFKVPGAGARAKVAPVARAEKPVTREDLIADDRPKSLADIVRHNRAVKAFGAGQAGRAGQAGDEQPKSKGAK